jgi:aldehyde:ferredoxin oxidoreductase
LVVCLFVIDGGGWALTGVKDLFNAITGWDFSTDDLLEAGERGFTSQRLINIRDGYNAKTDVLPKKMFQAAASGGRAGKVPPLADMLKQYYEVRGWDANGEPTDETLDRLGLTR